jgi:predicted DsbA family dithiol-disulfide isomerase
MKIDFVSDVSCPWCAIGLNALEQALDRVAPDIQATLHFQPFELNPQMPAEGQDTVEHLSQKYGIDAAQIAANAEAIRQRGASVGFTFGQGQRKRIYNTFDAHRLLHWAGLVDAGRQRALKHALFKAYFTDGLSPGDHGVLLAAAATAGLDAEQARSILAGDDFADDVREAEGFYHQQGISSVPAIIINDRHLISGGQPVELFERALRHIAAEAATAATTGASA